MDAKSNGEIFLEGKKFISLRKASSPTGYHKDYLGQICRQGLVVCRRIGNQWFVEENSLLNYESRAREGQFSQFKTEPKQAAVKIQIKEEQKTKPREDEIDKSDKWDELFFGKSALPIKPKTKLPLPSFIFPLTQATALLLIVGLVFQNPQGTFAKIREIGDAIKEIPKVAIKEVLPVYEKIFTEDIPDKLKETASAINIGALTYQKFLTEKIPEKTKSILFESGNVLTYRQPEDITAAVSPPEEKGIFEKAGSVLEGIGGFFQKTKEGAVAVFKNFSGKIEEFVGGQKEAITPELQKEVVIPPQPKIVESQKPKELAKSVSPVESELSNLRREVENLKTSGLKVSTVVEKPTVIEKTIYQLVSEITKQDFENQLSQINNKILAQYAELKNLVASRSDSNFAAIALSQRVNTLSNVQISSPTISGSGTIAGASLSISGTGGITGNATLGADLTVDSGTLYVDSANNRVGIGTTSPQYALDVDGVLRATSLVTSGQTIGGNLGVTGNLSVDGNSTLGNATTSDVVYINSRLAGHLIPTTDNLLDFGDATNWLRWRTGYFGTSVGIAGAATSTGTQLTASGAYLIDSAGALSINTTNNQNVIFGAGRIGLGTSTPLAKLNVYGGDVVFQTPSNSATAFQILNAATSSVFSVNTSSGTTTMPAFSVTGAGTSTITNNLDVSGTLRIGTGSSYLTSSGLNFSSNGSITSGTSGGLSVPYASSTGFTAANIWPTNIYGFTLQGALTGNSQNISGLGTLGAGTTTITNLAVTNTSTSTLTGGLTVGASQFVVQQSSGNVGIGTTSPNATLVLAPSSVSAGQTIFRFSNPATGSDVEIKMLNANDAAIYIGNDYFFKNTLRFSGNAYINASSNAILSLNDVSTGNVILATGGGNVGIGTTSPYAKLSVVGQTVAEYFTATSTSATSTFMGGLTVGTSQFAVQQATGNVGIGTTSPLSKLHSESATNLAVQNGGQLLLVDNTAMAAGVGGLLNFRGQYTSAAGYVEFAGIRGYKQTSVSGNPGGTLAFYTKDDAGNTWSTLGPRMVIDKDGNVGIGTASPANLLQIEGGGQNNLKVKNTGTSGGVIKLEGGGTGAREYWIFSSGSGNVIGAGKLSLGVDGNTALAIDSAGNVGIGTTPTYQLQLSTDSAGKPNGGSWANSSDMRLKTNIVPITNGLEKLIALNPVSYDWINPSLHGGTSSASFLAQEVQNVFPNWVNQISCTGADCPLVGGSKEYSLSLPFEYDAMVVSAIKELNLKIEDLEKKNASATDSASLFNLFLSWLSENIVKVKELVVGSQEKPTGITLYDKTTGAPYCLEIVNGTTVSTAGKCGASQSSASSSPQSQTSSPPPPPDTEPPAITIHGNNPAEVAIGTSYGDLGATAIDNIDGDISILIRTYVNGIEMNPVQIDTSTTTTYNIEYAVSDSAGNAATSSRRVVVYDLYANSTSTTSTSTSTQ